jgi:hypothetical protein
VLGASVSLVACRKPEQHPAPPPVASIVAKPIDHLARGELAPGDDTLDGLVLPRGMRVSAHFADTANAVGPMPPEDVANYLREHVDAQHVELGAVGTVFPAVRIKGGDQSKVFRIEVRGAGSGTEIVMRDVTPQPPVARDPGLSEEERWRRAGLKPNGVPIDQGHLR